MASGDIVSFDWKASSAVFEGGRLLANGGDAFDVFGYLLDVDTGDTIELINKHSYNQNYFMSSFQTEDITMNRPGNYKFVFISGTYDGTGGQWAGGSFNISNINVTQLAPPAANETTAKVRSEGRRSQCNIN